MNRSSFKRICQQQSRRNRGNAGANRQERGKQQSPTVCPAKRRIGAVPAKLFNQFQLLLNICSALARFTVMGRETKLFTELNSRLNCGTASSEHYCERIRSRESCRPTSKFVAAKIHGGTLGLTISIRYKIILCEKASSKQGSRFNQRGI